MGAGTIAGVAIAAFVVLLIFILAKYRPIVVVKEKQAIIIERLGKYTNTLTAGIHFVMPIISQPRKYSYHYFDTDPRTQRVKLVRKRNIMIISTSDEIQDYPATHIISRDNASCYLDCCLSYSIQNPRQMIYSCQNLPLMLQKCLQSHVRNVAGQLDIDQLIEESGSLKILTSLLQNEATRWGVRIRFVKVQNLKAQELEQDLARKKNAELQNSENIIKANSERQQVVIRAEGQRDSMIKEAEGMAQETLSRARGQAETILNAARAEASALRSLGAAIATTSHENPSKYFLAMRYMDAMSSIINSANTTLQQVTPEVLGIAGLQAMGLNVVAPK